MTNLIDELIEEHKTIRDHLEHYMEDPTKYFEELRKCLGHHTNVEESVLYPRARMFLKEETDHAIDEHDEADGMMAGLEDNPHNEDLFKELKKAIEHHLKEEEENYFPRVREEIDAKELTAMHDDGETLD